MRSCRVRAAVSFLRKDTARGHSLQTWGGFPPRPLSSLRESVITHSFALCRPATGVRQSGSRALALTTLPGEHADYGTLSFGVSGAHTTELHWHTVSLVPCSSRLLGQSAYASHVSLSDWLRVWPRSILRNELRDSCHRGRSVGSRPCRDQ